MADEVKAIKQDNAAYMAAYEKAFKAAADIFTHALRDAIVKMGEELEKPDYVALSDNHFGAYMGAHSTLSFWTGTVEGLLYEMVVPGADAKARLIEALARQREEARDEGKVVAGQHFKENNPDYNPG